MEFLKIDSKLQDTQPPVYSLLQRQNDLATIHPEVGPLDCYAVEELYIFTSHKTWKFINTQKPSDRHLPRYIPDSSKQYFFIIRKSDATVEGPLNKAEFFKHPAVQNVKLKWTTPPLKTNGVNSVVNIVIGLLLLSIEFWKVTLGILIFFIFLLAMLADIIIRRRWAARREREMEKAVEP
jgi:hypothetical protein